MLRRTLLIAVAAAVLVFAAGASSGTAGPAAASCQRPARTLAKVQATSLRTYDDYIEDAGSAPDFCASNFVTNDNEVVLVGLHVHNRGGFTAGDEYAILLDTDSNATTGSANGAEWVIFFDGGTASLGRWSSSSFDTSVPQASLEVTWLEDYGPLVSVSRAELGNPAAFDFIVASVRGDEGDVAPDTDEWQYQVAALKLKVLAFKQSAATAGKSFSAAMVVIRSDFDTELDEGTITCAAKVGAKTLAGTGRFVGDVPTCRWQIPRNARGKRLVGSVAVTFQGVQAKRAFSTRVR